MCCVFLTSLGLGSVVTGLVLEHGFSVGFHVFLTLYGVGATRVIVVVCIVVIVDGNGQL